MSIPRRIRRRVPNWCQSVQPFDSFPRLLNVWPLTLPSAPLCLEWKFGWRISIPRRICRCVPNVVPIGPAVCQLPNSFKSVTPYPAPRNAPWGIEGRLVFSLCPFQDESADVNQSWCQSDSFPILLNCWPPKTPKCPPCVSRGNLFGVYPFPNEFADVCQIWCQSTQPFDSFSRICAKVSSAFRRCTRWLAQKHAKKQHLYIDNYNSGPNMQTSTSLTFFTAIFVAFSGALAEELLIFYRHVRTELYIIIDIHIYCIFIYKCKKVTWLSLRVRSGRRPAGCICLCHRAASFTYFGEVLRCPHKRIVAITKVYIARNTIHMEIIRFHKN